MRRYSKVLTSVRWWRFVYILAAVFVLSYIAFDVLDLDLSDFPLSKTPRTRVVAVTESAKATKLASLFENQVLPVEPLLVNPSIFKESIRAQHKHLLRIFTFRADHVHVHRVAHPLSSTKDSPSAA